MLRPERMSEVSIFCLRKDIDLALEALDDFGNFHIEEAEESSRPIRYEQLIRQAEETLGELNALITQLKIEKTGFLDVFKAEKQTKTQITAENWQSLMEIVEEESSKLRTRVSSFTTSLKTLDGELSSLQRLQHMLRMLSRFKIDLETLEKLRFIYAAVTVVPSRNMYALRKALSSRLGIFYYRPVTKEVEFVFVAIPRKYKDEITRVLKAHHAEVFQIPKEIPRKLPKALKKVNDQLREASQNKNMILKSLGSLVEANKHRLLTLRETAQNILKVLRAKQKSSETERLVAVKGYVPKKELTKLQEKTNTGLNGRVLVLEKEFEASEDPPTRIHNPSFIKPFETITKLYGLPHYDELDPTLLIAITFPLIFGFMFGDVGHGLILVASGLVLGLMIKKHEGLRNFSWILAACGMGAVFAGLLFGEFFGKHLFAPLWFDPFEDVTEFLVFSLFIGIIQIMSGFVLDFVNFMLKGDMIDAFATSLPKMLFYIGSVYLILTCQLNFEVWFQGSILLPLIPFVFLILGKPVMVKTMEALGHPIKGTNMKDSVLERFFESGDLVTRLLSNTMSYARILALLMAHWALLLVTYTIADMAFAMPTSGIVVGALIVVGGNMFVMAFEGLIVFIHTLRLHFYEWFSKFYEGTGFGFSPFKHSRVYTKIVFKH